MGAGQLLQVFFGKAADNELWFGVFLILELNGDRALAYCFFVRLWLVSRQRRDGAGGNPINQCEAIHRVCSGHF